MYSAFPKFVPSVRSFVVNRRHGLAIRMAPPTKIEYSSGHVVLQQEVSRATFLIRIRSDSMDEYQPGHVLALAIPDPNQPDGELVHPYTITRSDKNKKTFDILYR